MTTKVITAFFTLNGMPLTGLVPTITIIEVGATNNTTVVTADDVGEISGGWYRYDFLSYDLAKQYVFTVDGGSSVTNISERYKYGGSEGHVEEIASKVWQEPAINHTDSGTTGLMLNQIKADTNSIAISAVTMTSLLNVLLKYERNRTKIDTASKQLIIYDDDGTTPLTTFELKDFDGMPSIQEVCERMPIT